MTIIFGIAGRKFAGKDTAANVLVEECGYVNVKFASGIKKIASAFFNRLFEAEGGIPLTAQQLFELTDGSRKEEHLELLKLKGNNAFRQFLESDANLLFDIFQVDLRTLDVPEFTGTTSREFQQFIGTEVGRNLVSTSVWTDAGLRDAAQYEKAVISDVRFVNEVEAIHNAHITHPDLFEEGNVVVRIERTSAEENEFSNHPSETAIDTLPVDKVIDNDYTLNDLYWSVLIAAGEEQEGTGAVGFFKEVA
jgi:hypothetical protein